MMHKVTRKGNIGSDTFDPGCGSGSGSSGSGSAKNLPLPLPHRLFDLKSN